MQRCAAEPWFAEWRERLDGWWGALPYADQLRMGECIGALGLHLGSRFDAAYNAWRAILGKYHP